jgi:hypothetical protein
MGTACLRTPESIQIARMCRYQAPPDMLVIRPELLIWRSSAEFVRAGVQPCRRLLSGLDVNDAEIWLKCKDDLTRYAGVLVGPSEAEDVVSTVFLRVLDRRRLEDLEDARLYLFRAVLNECKTRHARSWTVLGLADLPGPPPSDPQPEILEAVLSLPLRQRAATADFNQRWRHDSARRADPGIPLRPQRRLTPERHSDAQARRAVMCGSWLSEP